MQGSEPNRIFGEVPTGSPIGEQPVDGWARSPNKAPSPASASIKRAGWLEMLLNIIRRLPRSMSSVKLGAAMSDPSAGGQVEAFQASTWLSLSPKFLGVFVCLSVSEI